MMLKHSLTSSGTLRGTTPSSTIRVLSTSPLSKPTKACGRKSSTNDAPKKLAQRTRRREENQRRKSGKSKTNDNQTMIAALVA
jgi:hypothetical protein